MPGDGNHEGRHNDPEEYAQRPVDPPQLPSGWSFNSERFYDFLELLPSGYRFAFEFNDPSWHNPQAYEAPEHAQHRLVGRRMRESQCGFHPF